MFNNIKCDLQRYIHEDQRSFKIKIYLLFEQGIWAVIVYRFARWVRMIKVPIATPLLKIIAFLLFKLTEILSGISLPASAQIGKGLYIGHFGPIILHSDAVIGENCSFGPGVVIGTRGLGSKGSPVLGDNVYVGVGAKILGKIKIGNNVKIGANAVVLTDLPAGSTAVGVPAKIIKIKPEQRTVS